MHPLLKLKEIFGHNDDSLVCALLRDVPARKSHFGGLTRWADRNVPWFLGEGSRSPFSKGGMFSILTRGSCSSNFEQGGRHTHGVSALLFVCREYQKMMLAGDENRDELEDDYELQDELIVNDPYMRGPVFNPSEIAIKKRKVEIQKAVASFGLSFLIRYM